MGATERVKEFIDRKGITRYKFCQQLGFSNKFLDNSSNMGTDKAGKILHYYPDLNAEWLLTGNGNMLKINALTEEDIHYNQKKEADDGNFNIPLYDIRAAEGIKDLLGKNKNQIPLEYIGIPKITDCDGALYIAGDSMYPLLRNGDILAFKKINNPENIIWGEMYLIYISKDGDDFFFTRYIQQSDQDSFVKLVPQNPDYQPVEFPMSSVKAVALVKASIRINSQF
jgi:phage repressor protein C with HTH and peptisase S24 domain